MSNEQNFPVYSVPGTGETPTTVYYLRSFSSVPDTEITEDQFKGITDYIDSVTEGTQHDILAGHAAADPASPDFVAPAVNADVAGSAAAPISQPVQTPPVGEDAPLDPAAAPNGDGNFTQPEDTQGVSLNPGIIVQDQATAQEPEGPVVEGGEAPTPIEGTNGGQSEDNSGTVLPGSDASTPDADQGGSPDTGSPAGEDQAQPDAGDTGTTEADPGSGVPATEPGLPTEDQGTEAQAQPATEGETPVVTDPNENSQAPEPSSSTSGASDPNAQASEDQPSESSSTPDGGAEQQSSAVDPTNPEVIAGEPLPSSVTDNPGTLDPTTGEAPNLTDHPVDSAALPDPTIVQPPPPDVDHVSWFAKEKQRIIDLLRAESDRVSGMTEPEA